MRRKTRILILGGGFGGIYTAIELDRTIGCDPDVEITLVDRENFFLFTPMLHEVAASDLDPTNIVNPVRKLLRRVRFFEGEVVGIDLERRTAVLRHGSDGHEHEVECDHLVLALGSVTNFFGLPGVAASAQTMKTLSDAMRLRSRMIARLEEADTECACDERRPLLGFVVAGGGFAGVETIAAMNDFVREALPHYPNLSPEDIRMVLVHSQAVVLPELGPALGSYAQRQLAARGVEIRTNARVAGVDGDLVRLTDGTVVESRTLVWTAGTAANPRLEALPCAKERGRVLVDPCFRVPGHPGVWAVGDAASVPDGKGGFHPPTAQHAIRQGRTLARNIVASIRGREPRPFAFSTIGLLASIGRRRGVARIFGVNFSGFFAWWMWRTIYLSKLPRFEKKLRVAVDWTMDLFFTKDLVQHLDFEEARTAIESTPTT